MSPLLHQLAWFALTFSWMLLPLLPSIVELAKKRDVEPLFVANDHDGNIRNFAFGCKQFMQKLQHVVRESLEKGQTLTGVLPNGDEYVVLAPGDRNMLTEEEAASSAVQRVLVSAGPADLPAGILFAKEVYGNAALRSGAGSIFRTLLCEGDIELESDTVVLRWVHAEGKLVVGPNSTVHGRTSAEHLIELGIGCRFDRVHAPTIRFGVIPPTVPDAPSPADPAQSSVDRPLRRTLVQGDFDIPAGGHFEGNLVATGMVRVGRGATVVGSLKSNNNLYLEGSVDLDGAVVSSENLNIGDHCRIRGPVLAEREITISSGTRLGRPAQPTTVSATRIHVFSGVVAHGTVWAKEEGWVG